MCAASVANAIVIDDSPSSLMSTYNAIALGDYTTTSHTEGKFMVVGDITTTANVSGAPNVENVSDKEYSVVIGGNVYGNMTIQKGSALVSTNGVNSGVTLTNGGRGASFSDGNSIQMNSNGTVKLDSTLDLSSVSSSLINFSDALASLENDSGTTLSINQSSLAGNLVDSNGDGVVVATMSFSDLASIQNTNTSLLTGLVAGSGLLINVTGAPTTDTLVNKNWNDTFAANVLFNFVDASAGSSLNIGDFWGSILAPEANLTTSGVIEGTVVANDINHGNYEIHLSNLDSEFADKLEGLVVPEPSAYALILGMLSLGFAASRRRGR